MKRFFSSAWAVALVAMGGCSTTQGGAGGGSTADATTGVSGTGGSGGAGGQGGASSTTSTGTSGTGGTGGSSSSGTTSSASSSTGGDPCDSTYTCAEALDGDPTKLCDGKHGDLYDKFYACTCEPGGKCEPACGDNACMNGVYSAECTTCLKSTTTGCAKEYGACASDI